MRSPRLVHSEAPSRAVTLDAAQQQVADFLLTDSGSAVVLGEAGSGKTTLAVALSAQAVEHSGIAPEKILTLVPTRQAATSLRDRVAVATGMAASMPAVRTPAAAAFALVHEQAVERGEPPPTLVSGADHDAVLRELLRSHLDGVVPGPDWSGVVAPHATVLPAFRSELRDVIMRAVEAGWSPEDLAVHGHTYERPEWVAAAQVFREYDAVMSLAAGPADQGARLDPPAVLSLGTEALKVTSRVWDLVILDDAQDVTLAVWRFVRGLQAHGARVLVLANADQSVESFRGAVPSAVSQAVDPVEDGGLGARVFRLGASHRVGGEVLAAARALVHGLPSVPGAVDRPIEAPEGGATLTCEPCLGTHDEGRIVAAHVRRAHAQAGAGSAWNRIAVIAPTRTRVQEMRTALQRADIPTAASADGAALRAHPVVTALLDMAAVAAGASWTPARIERVLLSRAVGIDAGGFRRLRRALVREERAGDGARTSTELMVEALAAEAHVVTLDIPEAQQVARVARAVTRARSIAQRPAATPGAVLWAVWDELHVAETWQQAALAGSRRDDEDLDAVIAVMKVAHQFEERRHAAGIDAFVEYLEAHDFAADSLAARGAYDGVEVVTPAGATGRQWDFVVVTGLEEGIWPDTRLRGSVLGAPALLDVVTGRDTEPFPQRTESPAYVAAARAEVLAESARALYVALTRTCGDVVVTWAEGEDIQRSRFVQTLTRAVGQSVPRLDRSFASHQEIESVEEEANATPPLRPFAHMREAIAHLRRDGSEEAAFTLAHMYQAGVTHAHPDTWHGVAGLTTEEPVWDSDTPVRVSPSHVSEVEKCALRWVLKSHGGQPEAGTAQVLGTLLHTLAEQHPHGTEDELMEAFHALWPSHDVSDTWSGRRLQDKAEHMVRRLAQYISDTDADSVETETHVRFQTSEAVLSGSIDRLHIRDGEATVVDLKTGATLPSKAEALQDPQLQMYQLAVAEGSVPGVEDSAGAALVFLGTGKDGPTLRSQSALNPATAKERLHAAVGRMRGPDFGATVGDHCRGCPVSRACPAQPEGTQVTERWRGAVDND